MQRDTLTVMAQIPSPGQEKRRQFQQHLVLLLHGQMCTKKQQRASGLVVQKKCTFPHCDKMKQLLKHMDKCKKEKYCRIRYCWTSRQIINHWKKCPKTSACTICRSVRRIFKVYNKPNPKPQSDAFHKDFESFFFPLNLCTRPGEDWRFSLNQSNVRMQIIENIVKALFPNEDVFTPPRPFIMGSLQQQVGQKLVNAIFPSKQTVHQLADPQECVLALCHDYAAKIEGNMFLQAQSFEEYHDQIVDKSFNQFITQIQSLLKTSVIFPFDDDLRQWFISLGYRPLYQSTLVHIENAFAALGVPFNPVTTFEPNPKWRDLIDSEYRTLILYKFITSFPLVLMADRFKVHTDAKNMEFFMYTRAKSLNEYSFLIASELCLVHKFAIIESNRYFGPEHANGLVGPN